MKRIRNSTIVSQYCLDDKRVVDFISSIPNLISIKEIYWEGDSESKWIRLHVPEYLIKRGVSFVKENKLRKLVTGTFVDMSRKEMIDTLKIISNKYEIPLEKFYVRRVVLFDGNTRATFKRVRKQIKDTEDKRRKRMYLGLCSPSEKPLLGGNGKYQNILEALSSKKVACQFIDELKRIIVCSEVK